MREHVLAKQRGTLPPVTAKRAGAERGRVARTVAEPAPTARIAIALHRACLDVGEPGGYFKLKMLLVRTLRRGFKTCILEVDDAEGPPAAGAEPFKVTVEPSDPQDHARAVRTVRRVLRSRRWLR